MTRTAVLITFHNRKAKTLNALDALYQQSALSFEGQIIVYGVDDGSTDGTSAAVAERFPQVRLLAGSGNLYWAGGMRLAFGEALKEDFDYYLWLNDDAVLFGGALANLLQTAAGFKDEAIVAGSMQDPDSLALTYGGVKREYRWHPLRFQQVVPGEAPLEADTMNGNCVLIPRKVACKTGNLDPVFTHGIGDFDYGLRARRLGFRVVVAPGYCGYCKRNDLSGSWRDPAVPFQKRLKLVSKPDGYPPVERAVFARRYGGVFWPFFWAIAYRRLFFPARLVGRSTQKPGSLWDTGRDQVLVDEEKSG